MSGRLFGPGDGLAATAVVEEGVDRLLEHAALVADDDLRRVELEQALQAVVAVDDAAVEIVEIAGREAAAVERDERAEIRREHRDHRQHHPLGPVAALAEGLDDLEALRELLALRLAGRRAHLGAEQLGERVHVDLLEHLEDGLAAHAGRELVVAVLVDELEVALLAEEIALLQAGLLRVDDDVRLAVEDLLEILQRDVEHVADARRQALQEPDVRDRRGERDVPEALTTHLGLDHLDAALLAHDPAVLHALVLAAVALVVLHRPEDLRAEQAIPLRLEGAVVDGLGLLHLAVRPLPDLLRAGERDADRAERERVLGLLEEAEDVTHRDHSSIRAREGSSSSSCRRGLHGLASTSSTFRHNDCSSLMSTLKLSGSPASSV